MWNQHKPRQSIYSNETQTDVHLLLILSDIKQLDKTAKHRALSYDASAAARV